MKGTIEYMRADEIRANGAVDGNERYVIAIAEVN